MYIKITASRRWDVFFETRCRLTVIFIYYSKTLDDNDDDEIKNNSSYLSVLAGIKLININKATVIKLLLTFHNIYHVIQIAF